MTEQFEYEGEWWFPQQPEHHFRGKLYSSKDGARLRFVFNDDSREMAEGMRKRGIVNDVILGISTDGTKITVYKYWLKSIVEFQSGFVFFGVHLDIPAHIQFKRMSVQFQHLDSWVNTPGFCIKQTKSGVMLRRKLPKDIQFPVNNDLSVTIHFGEESKVQQTEVVRQNAWLLIEPSSPRNFDEFLNTIQTLKNFLTLAVSVPTYFTVVEGKTESAETIRIVFWRDPHRLETSTDIPPQIMLFTLKDIILRKRTILRKWFERKETLKPVFDLYFGAIYQEMYINNEFLNLMQALESYHRITMKNTELSPKQHQKRIEAIIKATPHKYQEWLQKKFEHSNEPNLRKRFDQILKSCPSGISTQLGNNKVFINKVVNTRHYWTHFDNKQKVKSVSNEELCELADKLRLLLQFSLLKEIGFEPEDAEKRILKNRETLF